MHLEKEIKILNIDVADIQEKLVKIGAIFHGKKEQFLYTYDVSTIYYRFLEISMLLHSESNLIYLTNLQKLKLLLEEVNELLSDQFKQIICLKYEIDDITKIVNKDKLIILDFVDNELVNKELKKYLINPNKWIRLRRSNDKVELTVKHILNSRNDNQVFENVIENEIQTSSFEETNTLLEALGFMKRNYQEKIRYSYSYDSASIEIDIWPMLEPYIEIECDDLNLIEKIVSILELDNQKIVSCNTEKLYEEIGIDIKSIPELKFN